jgi:hypothetical protein
MDGGSIFWLNRTGNGLGSHRADSRYDGWLLSRRGHLLRAAALDAAAEGCGLRR